MTIAAARRRAAYRRKLWELYSGNHVNVQMPGSFRDSPGDFMKGNNFNIPVNVRASATEGARRRRLMNWDQFTNDMEHIGDQMMAVVSPPRTQSVAARAAPGAQQAARAFGETPATERIMQRQLYVDAIPFPPQGADVGLRLGSTIKVSGFHLCETFKNPNRYPVLLHYAILQAKSPGLTEADDIRTDFFRNTDIGSGSNSRTKPFLDAVVPNPFDYGYNKDGINPDAFHILCHKKVILGGDNVHFGTTDVNEDSQRSHWRMDQYFNMKGKKLTFKDNTDIYSEHPILRVVWFQAVSGPDFSVNQGVNHYLGRNKRHTVYFKNGLN